ncbi:hypothetical protein D3C80_1148800 [compost metagenome]
MEEHEHRQVALCPFWTYNPNIQASALYLDAPTLDLDTREIYLHAGLGTAQHGAGVFRREGFQRFTTACFQGLKKRLGGGFDTRATRSECTINGNGKKAGGECA